VLAGDDDPIIALSTARLLARLVPDATMRVIPGGGHLFLLDESRLSATLVDDFLRAP
jgi:pimeloyl-ACP methyl ester carboxylesterase